MSKNIQDDPVVIERIIKLIKQQRKEIIRQEDEEDNKYRRKIVK